MTFRDVLGGGPAQGVPWHTHDGADISGEIVASTMKAERFLGGVITGKEIIIAGGVDGIIRSDNFVAGSAGWRVLGDGSAEFSSIVIRGEIITGSATLSATGTLESDNFVAGTSGWQIDGDGSAEFQDAIIRGTLNASDITAGLLNAARIGAGTIGVEVIKLSDNAGSRIESNDGTSLIIRGNGSAVFTDVIITTGDLTVTDGTESIILKGSGWGSTQATIIFDVAATSQEPEITGSKTDGTLFLSGGGAVNNTQIKIAGGIPRIDFEVNGSDRWRIDADQLFANVGSGRLRAGVGTAGLPSLSFVGDIDTGFYRQTTNIIGITTGGVNRGQFDSSGFFVNVSGSAGTPAIRLNDVNTGFYLIASDRIGMATGGGFRWEISSGKLTNVAGGSTSASNTTPRTLLGSAGALNIFVAASAQTIIAGRNSDGGVIDFRRSGTQVGTISVTTTATAYNTSSDRRLKKEIEDLEGALAAIGRLRPRSYLWKVDDSPGVSLIAQEAVKVVPQIVKRPDREADSWGIDNAQLVPWLVGAIQELTERVEELEAA